MPIKNFTTSIDYHTTLSEVTRMLSKAGANKIIQDNNSEGMPIGITFQLVWDYNTFSYALPCNFQGVLKAMEKDKKVPRRMCNKDQALKVGWRIVKDWISAQLAIVEAEVASMPEIFLPYAVTPDGDTLFTKIQNNKKMLAIGPA